MSSAYYAQIWQTIRQIPAGKVASYGQIADLAGLPGRARLVGKALGMAPETIPLPWHRVLRASGCIAFAVGSSDFERQRRLLESEGCVVAAQGRVKAARRQAQSLDEALWGGLFPD